MNIINTDKLNDEKMTNDIINLSNNKNDKKEDKNEIYIKEILGYDFEYKNIFGETENKLTTYCFEFVNKSNISNQLKSIYIKKKVDELINNGFTEIQDLKIPKVGRFLVIKIKTIDDYEEEKIKLEKEYLNKITEIDLKINLLKMSNNSISKLKINKII